MNREALVALLTETVADLTALAAQVDDGLIVRIRDSFPGHPQSPSFDAGQSTNRPPENLPDELRGRTIHSDPTGQAAVQSIDHGNQGRDDAKSLMKDIAALRKTARHAMDTASRYTARKPNVLDQAGAEEPGCQSCARIPGPSGKPWWNPATRSTTLASGAKVSICGWCYDTPRLGARWSGQLPPVEDVLSYRDNGRARKRSA